MLKAFIEEQRVKQFVRVALEDARTNNVVIMGETGGGTNPRYGWPEMRDPKFREDVLSRLNSRLEISNAKFSAPDEYDDWTFSAYPVK